MAHDCCVVGNAVNVPLAEADAPYNTELDVGGETG